MTAEHLQQQERCGDDQKHHYANNDSALQKLTDLEPSALISMHALKTYAADASTSMRWLLVKTYLKVGLLVLFVGFLFGRM